MARIRSIKPEFWTSEQLAECSPNARLLFIGLWSFSDDNGIHPASVPRLKMEIFPADDFSRADVAAMVDELLGARLLREYEVEGDRYWQVTGWHHQRIDRPTFKHPLPSGEVPQAPPRPEPSSVLHNNSRQRRSLMQQVIDRDGRNCAYCGCQEGPFDLDHIIPASQGGSDDLDNLCRACQGCNRTKGAESVVELARAKGLRIEDMSLSIRRGIGEASPPERRGEERKGEEGRGEEKAKDDFVLSPAGEQGAGSDKSADVHTHPATQRLFDLVLAAYHSTLPKCQRISVLNPKRRRRIQAADKLARQVCRDQGWEYAPGDFWDAYFDQCLGDEWLRGDRANPNNPAWKQNLDVLLHEDRFAQIMDRAIAAMQAGEQAA